jgi:hypothetical protein
MLAIVNGGPSDLWVENNSRGVRDSIIIGVLQNTRQRSLLVIANQALAGGIWEICMEGSSLFYSSCVLHLPN